ncbi:YceI family protein [Flavilitoribacter nigricans]|uniref:Lipid/polyisoprenoid-binding YceI-like domain-containing protein n=1 Tax=Flavilitoribacter nigricans (strain ATCC 23147 / DSM 23189 / NBRC 102662 / NCIMB 1420 / SS-2) TaxID=1122177 RepID=A0A2D0NHU4_FLAN2|nr:YceI family protein [Flavilitoribacter nigricans]PHN07950.1 hypothetical protein CRP01_04125 [Flavilitoribacter nigricans DSM 23189 = NBRC 102662]
MEQLRICLGILAWLVFGNTVSGQSHFIARDGMIHFKSDAPLELIEARSEHLSGVLQPESDGFAFSVDIRSFQGFNSPLQREHFNENYLESRRFPRATFTGKIIEDIDFSEPGSYEVRAKGQLEVHGVRQERIIKGRLDIGKDGIRISAAFSVLLEDHQISIPQIVYQKIAEEILVDLNINLRPLEAK